MVFPHAKLNVDGIVNSLRDKILTGTYPPGERLVETDLADEFGVSRGPVRDALKRLAGVGLVTAKNNVGVQVRTFSLADAKAFYQLREALEVQVAQLAAQHAGDAEMARIKYLLHEHEELIHRHPDGAYVQDEKDQDFHLVLVDIASNPLIHKLLADELYPQSVLLRRSHRMVIGRGAKAFFEHQQIAEAIYANDHVLAGMLMTRHIQSSWRSFYNGQLSNSEK